MKKWILLAMALLLSACSSDGDKRYYQLPLAAPAGVSASQSSSGHHLWLSRVSLSDYLAGNGLVYQTNEVQYVMANNNLWASPLEQQLQQTLVANLAAALPGWLVASSPYASDTEQDTLEVNVTGFHGRWDGRAVVQGDWVLTHQGKISKQPFNLILAQDQDGYDALVKTLARGWQQVSQNIAKEASVIN